MTPWGLLRKPFGVLRDSLGATWGTLRDSVRIPLHVLRDSSGSHHGLLRDSLRIH